MNIKSLLLGSAAALVAVSGARAADAVEVVAEPEPMEYVRVCDTYGAGFYYIPGTETCLRVGGYIRYDIGVGQQGLRDVVDKEDFVDNGVLDTNDTYYKRARFALQVDARSETELGTLRGYAQINFNYTTNTTADVIDFDGDGVADDQEGGGFTFASDAGSSINHAYIELGGFRIGKTDSLFVTFTNYAGGVISDDIVPYGPFDTHQIVYTFNAGNGFTAAVGLEEGAGLEYTLDSYIPHVVAGVGYTGGWGGVSVVGGYNSVWEEWAVKARLDVKVSEALSLFVMGGWASNETDDEFTTDNPTSTATGLAIRQSGAVVPTRSTTRLLPTFRSPMTKVKTSQLSLTSNTNWFRASGSHLKSSTPTTSVMTMTKTMAMNSAASCASSVTSNRHQVG